MSEKNLRDTFTIKLNQARTMLLAISGSGLDGFEELHEKDKDYYLYAIFTLVEESLEASNQI